MSVPSNATKQPAPLLLISLNVTLGFYGQATFCIIYIHERSDILPYSGGTSVLQQGLVSRKQDDRQLGG